MPLRPGHGLGQLVAHQNTSDKMSRGPTLWPTVHRFLLWEFNGYREPQVLAHVGDGLALVIGGRSNG